MAYSKDISDIIRTLAESGFEDAEVRLDDLYIRVSSGSSSADTGSNRCPESRPASDPAPSLVTPEAEGPVKDIKAPTLGTFYRAPSPGAPPFIKVGDRVVAGQTVGIVEVMKLFNTVETDVAGTVVAIYAEDGVLVEYDQPLVTVRVG